MSKEQFQNACVFCGKKNVTREHIFPVWLGKLAPATTTTTKLTVKRITLLPNKDIENLSRVTGRPITSMKLKKFCGECNGGWMSAIEDQMQKIFIKFKNCLFGISLTDQEVKTLNSWCVLKTIEWDLTSKHTSAIPEEDIAYYYEHRSPPPNWTVWIGHYQNEDGCMNPNPLQRTALLGSSKNPNPTPFNEKEYNCQSTTLCIPPLYIHTISHSPEIKHIFTNAYKKDKYVIKAWPRKSKFHYKFKSLPKIDYTIALYLNHTFGDSLEHNISDIEHRF